MEPQLTAQQIFDFANNNGIRVARGSSINPPNVGLCARGILYNMAGCPYRNYPIDGNYWNFEEAAQAVQDTLYLTYDELHEIERGFEQVHSHSHISPSNLIDYYWIGVALARMAGLPDRQVLADKNPVTY